MIKLKPAVRHMRRKKYKANRRNKTTLGAQQQVRSPPSSIQGKHPVPLRSSSRTTQPSLLDQKNTSNNGCQENTVLSDSLSPLFKLSSNLIALLVKTSSRLVSCFNVILEVGCSKSLIFIGLLLFAAVRPF